MAKKATDIKYLQCDNCGKDVVHDGNQWVHVATHTPKCNIAGRNVGSGVAYPPPEDDEVTEEETAAGLGALFEEENLREQFAPKDGAAQFEEHDPRYLVDILGKSVINLGDIDRKIADLKHDRKAAVEGQQRYIMKHFFSLQKAGVVKVQINHRKLHKIMSEKFE